MNGNTGFTERTTED